MRIEKIKIPQGVALDGIAFKGSDGEYFDPSTLVVEYMELESVNPQLVLPVKDEYVDDGTPPNAKCGMGVEIEGWLFIPEEIKSDESFRRRNFQRTKIMSGGEFVSRTAYVPRKYSFTCYYDVEPEKPYVWDQIFTKMENKKCKVISPYISSNPFYAEVQIKKTNPRGAPDTLKLDVTLTEIPTAKLRITGDAEIQYPVTNSLSGAAIQVKTEINEHESEDSGQDITKDDLKFNDDNTMIDPNKSEK